MGHVRNSQQDGMIGLPKRQHPRSTAMARIWSYSSFICSTCGLVQLFKADPADFKDRPVKADETRLRHWYPETRIGVQAMEAQCNTAVQHVLETT